MTDIRSFKLKTERAQKTRTPTITITVGEALDVLGAFDELTWAEQALLDAISELEDTLENLQEPGKKEEQIAPIAPRTIVRDGGSFA